MYGALITFLRQKTTIKFRIYLFSLVMLGLFYFASIFSFTNHLNNVKQEKQKAINFIVTELLSKTADHALWRGNKEELDSVIETLINSTEIIKIVVFDSKGDVFTKGVLEGNRTRGIEHFSVAITRKKVAAEFNDFDADMDSVKDEIINVGRIDIEIDQDALSEIVWSVMLDKSLALILAGLAAIPIAYILAMSLVRPLRSIMNDLKRFESGDYSPENYQEKYKDEYALLSQALQRAGNSIARKTIEIEKTNDELKRHSKELEKQVEVAIEARESADEANARKDIFVANISHELKTPLTGVVSGLDLIEQSVFGVLSQIEYLDDSPLDFKTKKRLTNDVMQLISCIDIAKYSGAQIETMVNEILASIQDVYAEVTIEERPVQLMESVLKLIQSHEFLARQKGIEFSFELSEPGDIWVITDWIRIAQILNALIGNAIRFTEQGQVYVNVRALPTTDNVSLFVEVKDTGIGITDSEKDFIFNLFHIGENPSKKVASGIGTGLAIAKRITQRLGGTLSLKSSIIGKGSCFTFDCTFKQYTKKNKLAFESTSRPPAFSPAYTLNLLYVEDSLINQQIFQQYCLESGINLIMAKNGMDGFEKYLRGRFDALVIDCYMPVMNGFELVEKIREHEQGTGSNRALIFALTADGSETNRKRCIETGFDEFITKPYSYGTFHLMRRQAASNKES